MAEFEVVLDCPLCDDGAELVGEYEQGAPGTRWEPGEPDSLLALTGCAHAEGYMALPSPLSSEELRLMDRALQRAVSDYAITQAERAQEAQEARWEAKEDR
jgi:hypothetical protein